MKKVRQAGFTVVELLAFVAGVIIFALIVLPYFARSHRPSSRLRCVNNLKMIGLAFRIFSTDNGDKFPGELHLTNGFLGIDGSAVFTYLTNEIATPKILYCPQDTKRKEALSLTNFSSKNISYFSSLTANETNYMMFLSGDRNLKSGGKPAGPGVFALTTNTALGWTEEIHVNQGNVAMADGSVRQFPQAALGNAVREQGVATNLLVIP